MNDCNQPHLSGARNTSGTARIPRHDAKEVPIPWQEEIRRTLAAGRKYELDALANKDFRYLTKTYLAKKLKAKDWLD